MSVHAHKFGDRSADRHPWTIGKPWQWPDSLWAETATEAIDAVSLQGVSEADTCIVGGGYTGLSAALHLAEANQSVTLLEAAAPGWGCSGRNGGQINPAWKHLPSAAVAQFGEQAAKGALQLAMDSCELVFDLIRRHGIDCEMVRPGYVQGGVNRHGRKFIDGWVREWQDLGVDVCPLNKAQMADLLGSDYYDFGMLDGRGGNIQPLSYLRGLHRASIDAGAIVHGDSPVIEVTRKDSTWCCTTPTGEVRARNLLWCTNGYTDHAFARLRQTLVPVTSFIIATEPLTEHQLSQVLPGRHAVFETKWVSVYYKRDAGGRFVFGGRGNLWDTGLNGGVEHMKRLAVKMFPALDGIRWTHKWGGHPAMTMDGYPKLLRIGEQAFAGQGYNGRGVNMATMMGKQLAHAVVGEPTLLAAEPLQPIAFHTLRQLGISTYLIKGRLLDTCGL